MSSAAILSIIFITVLAAAIFTRVILKRWFATKLILGIGALVLTGVAYLLDNETIPAWILALSGIILLLDAFMNNKVKNNN